MIEPSAEGIGNIAAGGLTSLAESCSRSAGLYRNRWKTVLSIMLLGNAAVLASFLAAVIASIASAIIAPRLLDVMVVMAVFSAVAFSAASVLWCHAAMLLAVAQSGPSLAVTACLQCAWGKLPGFLLTCGLYIATCVGGLFLLAVPGLAACLWLVFAPIIFLTEDVGPFEALLKSIHYVQGRSLPVAGRLLLIEAAGFLPGFIPLAGGISQMLAWPFVWINISAVLNDLRRLRHDETFMPSRQMKILLLSAMAGCLVPVILLPWALPWLRRFLLTRSWIAPLSLMLAALRGR